MIIGAFFLRFERGIILSKRSHSCHHFPDLLLPSNGRILFFFYLTIKKGRGGAQELWPPLENRERIKKKIKNKKDEKAA